jgi:hypothetical protein
MKFLGGYRGRVGALEHSVADEAIVERQIGRPARGQWTVARRCHLGLPMVIENHPRLDDGTPFPTLYWLTCPILSARAARLEASGVMADLTELLGRDAALMQRFEAAVRDYRALRDKRAVLDPDSAVPGGGPDRVKCLHAHLGHELAAPPNPIGALTLAATGWPDCRLPCVTQPGKEAG